MDKILVVDDDKLFIESLRVGLKKYASQFTALFAMSVDEALEILKRESIAVLVTDMVMPGKDGLDLFAYKDQFHPKMQCIIMTGYGTDELSQLARMDGAFCYIQKPVKLSDLGAAILRAMESRDEGDVFKPILMASLLKLVQTRKKTCILEVEHGKTEKGALHFIGGVLFDAVCGELEGKDAALKMMSWSRVHFRFQTFPKKVLEDRIRVLINHIIKEENLGGAPTEGVGIFQENDHQTAINVETILAETLREILNQDMAVQVKEEIGELFDDGRDKDFDAQVKEETKVIEARLQPIRLLIVDDSKMMRKALVDIFRLDERIQVVGECENGQEALEAIGRMAVDVMTLDVEMPLMDGLTTLKHLMIKHPLPAVMVSSLTHEGASATFDALKLGAVDFVPKPSRLAGVDMDKQAAEIIRKVKLAADVEIRALHFIRGGKNKGEMENDALIHQCGCEKIVAIGAAEGGYGALLKILPRLSLPFQGACLVMLHAKSAHVNAFVRYLGPCSHIRVKRPVNGETILGGHCYIASSDEYLTIHEHHQELLLQVNPAPTFTTRSNINIMMFSAAETMNARVTGVILSGSGSDGAEGLEEISRIGGTTIVQEPKSALYKQMPETAISRVRAGKVLPDNDIARELLKDIQQYPMTRKSVGVREERICAV